MLSYSVICVLFLSSFQLLNAFNQTDNYFDESEYVEEVRRHMQEVRDQFGDDLKDTYERDITDYIRRRKRSFGKACDLPKQIGINDACMCQSGPHKTMVELEMINGDISGNTLQMPRCISIDRCSSSCSSPTHKCVAVDKEMVKVPVSTRLRVATLKGPEGFHSKSHPKLRWKSIRDKYVREKKFMDGQKLSGSGCSSREVWDLYESLHFLKDSISHRKTINNMSQANKDEAADKNPDKPEDSHEEMVFEHEDEDFIIEEPINEAANALSDADQGNNSLPKPRKTSSTSSLSASDSRPSTSSSKRESEETFMKSAKYKKPKQKVDAYEQTLLNIWKENTGKINASSCNAIPEDPDRLFLLSLEKDFKSLNDKNKRKAKHALMQVLDDLLEEEERDKLAEQIN